MNIEINLDKGLGSAIKQLKDLEKRLNNFPKYLAEEVSSDVTYNHKVDAGKGNTTIIASEDGIAFREYGAGFVADETTIGEMDTYPGVWSEDHAKTFENWDKDPLDYPYNRYPERQMTKAVEKLEVLSEDIAAEYFR